MNSTAKLIFASVIAANLAVIIAVSIYTGHRHSAADTQVVQLGKIVVTPANAETPTIELGTVVVTPTDADWRFAETYGVHRPGSESVAQATGGVDAVEDQSALVSLLQSMAALGPGQYLDTDAALRALNALVFDSQGR